MAEKPLAVLAYNTGKVGVDLHDSLETEYQYNFAVNKCHKKLLIHELHSMLTQAYILYKMKHEKVEHKDFILIIVRELILTSGQRINSNPQMGVTVTNQLDIARLTGRHFPSKVPSLGAEKSGRKICVVCSKKGQRKRTVFQCTDCGIGLCPTPCFKAFHTKKNYWVGGEEDDVEEVGGS